MCTIRYKPVELGSLLASATTDACENGGADKTPADTNRRKQENKEYFIRFIKKGAWWAGA